MGSRINEAENQYRIGMELYHQQRFADAEPYLESFAKNENADKIKREKVKKLLAGDEFGRLYNISNRVTYAASRMTAGGNAPSGGWGKMN